MKNEYSLQAGATTYGYDANGNMVSKTEAGETTVYSYDYANRLTQLSTPNSQLLYSYDGYGRRISRLAKGGGFGIPEHEKTEYLWDGTNVLLEFYQNKGNPLEYIYGNGQMISRDDLLVLSVSKRLVYQNSHWFHPDGLGSVVNLTDSAGNTKLTYAYDAFGEITKEQGQVGWKKNRYTFTGKPYDPASGMYYFGARWYEPEVGRFVTKDLYTWVSDDPRILKNDLFMLPILQSKNRNLQNLSIWQLQNPEVSPYLLHTINTYLISHSGLRNPQYLHRYVYCKDNPVRYIDPYGLSWWENLKDWLKEMGWLITDEVAHNPIPSQTVESSGPTTQAAAAVAANRINTEEQLKALQDPNYIPQFYDPQEAHEKPGKFYQWLEIYKSQEKK